MQPTPGAGVDDAGSQDSSAPAVACGEMTACGGCVGASCTWCGNGVGGGTCVPAGSGGSCTGVATSASQCAAVDCFQSGATCAQSTDCCTAVCTPNDPTNPSAGGSCL